MKWMVEGKVDGAEVGDVSQAVLYYRGLERKVDWDWEKWKENGNENESDREKDVRDLRGDEGGSG